MALMAGLDFKIMNCLAVKWLKAVEVECGIYQLTLDVGFGVAPNGYIYSGGLKLTLRASQVFIACLDGPLSFEDRRSCCN